MSRRNLVNNKRRAEHEARERARLEQQQHQEHETIPAEVMAATQAAKAAAVNNQEQAPNE